jgi:hypothetical protein
MSNKPSSKWRDVMPNKQPTSVTTPRKQTVPRIYEVVVACRDEDDQRTVFERMRAEGYCCRVLTL